jgi:Skp family chaperone for outer membrane proteins
MQLSYRSVARAARPSAVCRTFARPSAWGALALLAAALTASSLEAQQSSGRRVASRSVSGIGTGPATGLATGLAAGTATRIAFVDVALLLDSVPGRASVESRFADELRLAETRVRLATDSLERAVAQFSRQQEQLAPMQREAAMLTLRARELQLEDMVQQLNRAVLERRDALAGPLMVCLQRAVREVQARDGWHVITDVAAWSGLTEPHPDVMVTGQVLAALRARADEPCGAR